ncbi:MAG: glycosyltransferase, partial [Anaerolineae bacterium]|nr:glycosyltransferase [Anaerolineae bacterium]
TPEQIDVIGLPVADRFCQPAGDKNEIRERLGWAPDVPTVLLVGGGEGMGPLEQTAMAINDAALPVSLVIIAGRNRKLKARLERLTWNVPVYIYGFVRDMPDFMRASDILVTKAGPGTICEAFIAGLPLILYSRMPGQEDGNVDYVVNEKAGVWAPTPDKVVYTIKDWLNHPQKRQKVVETCLKLARPQAARQIGRILAAGVGVVSK